jgi:hypothetical protein
MDGLAREPGGTLVALTINNVSQGTLMRVDPASGDRVIVSDEMVGSGPVMTWPTDIAVEADGMLVVSDYDVGVFRIDPVSGDRTVVSGWTSETGEVGGGDGYLLTPWSITVVPVPSLSLAGRGLLLLVLCAFGRAFIARTPAGRRGHPPTSTRQVVSLDGGGSCLQGPVTSPGA